MPCEVNFEACNKTQCDKSCKTCIHWIPSYASPIHRCIAPLHIRLSCMKPRSACADCQYYIADLRKTDKDTHKRERAKRYRIAHPEGEKARLRRWKRKNAKKVKAYNKAWRERNKARIAAYKRAYRKQKKLEKADQPASE